MFLLSLDVCCACRKAKKQAVGWWNDSNWITNPQVISRLRNIISEITVWFAAGVVCVQSKYSEEAVVVIVSVTGQEGLASSLLGVSVWEPSSCCRWDLLDLWSRWKRCGMQGLMSASLSFVCCAFIAVLLLSSLCSVSSLHVTFTLDIFRYKYLENC